jgi:mRNA interferase HigB
VGILGVRIFGEAEIAAFAKKHATARKPLIRFVELVRDAQWQHMPDVRATFPGADFDPKNQQYIFDIGGNNYRLHASIDFEEQAVSVDEILTHAEYDKR